MANCFNFKSVKAVNQTTCQQVSRLCQQATKTCQNIIEDKQDKVKIKIKHNKDIVKKRSIVGDNNEYIECFLDKQNIITYIKTRVSMNKNLFNLCINMDKKIEITRYKLENNKKTLIDTDKKLVLSNMEARAFLKRAERTISNNEIN
mgnify:CR=1 FL=1